MRKILVVFVAVMLSLFVFGCGEKRVEVDNEAINNAKTLGDVYAISDLEENGFTYNDEQMAILFMGENAIYKFYVKMTKDAYDRLDAIDFFDEERDEKYKEIFKELKIERVEDLFKAIPTQEELDKLIGKTGQELLDDDYYYCGHSFYQETLYYLDKGNYEFEVVFNETVDWEELPDDFDGEEFLATLTVKKVTYSGLSSSAPDFE